MVIHDMPRVFCIVLMVSAFSLAGQSPVQVLKALHNFADSGPINLVVSNDTLYGTVDGDGATNQGSVFMLKTDGTGFTTLHSFVGSDGAYPSGRMALSGSTLYGTTRGGGVAGNGTIFKLNTDGSGFMNLYSFSAFIGPSTSLNRDGAYPLGDVALLGETLYGAADGGGGAGNGTVFAINLDGTGFRSLHSFDSDQGTAQPNGVIGSDNVLYGTFQGGVGYSGPGGVFAIRTNGTGFTILHSFSYRDGAYPLGGLTVSNKMLLGTTGGGGQWNGGTVFSLLTDGSGFELLHEFIPPEEERNEDGGDPHGTLALRGGTVYGVGTVEVATTSGAISQHGVIFGVNLDSSSFKTIYSFPNGVGPVNGVLSSGNMVYGGVGSSGGSVTLFSVAVTAPLSIVAYGSDLILTWPLIPSGFSLQSSTSLLSSIWVPVSPGPVVVNGQNMVISPSFGPQQFFRLSQ
jgi:uncharacterized repeat protein (TIGR03803 family)